MHERVEGSYAAIALVAGYGLLAFRDPFGIRPLILGVRPAEEGGRQEWVVASDSLVLENGGFEIVRDVEPGEAVYIDLDGTLHSRQCAADPQLVPCSFEYVYLARPDTIMNGISVYEARLRMGDRLADTIVDALDPRGVLVVLDAQHACVTTRGAHQTDASTVTIASRGELGDPVARAELITLIGRGVA